MVTVFIWYPRPFKLQFGHTAMQVLSQYVSWWPDQRPFLSGLGLGVWPGQPHENWHQDNVAEGAYPHSQIAISRLDERSIVRWWQTNRFALEWRALSYNCSTVVAEALRAGGADQLRRGWDAGIVGNRWTPRLLEKAALTLQSQQR